MALATTPGKKLNRPWARFHSDADRVVLLRPIWSSLIPPLVIFGVRTSHKMGSARPTRDSHQLTKNATGRRAWNATISITIPSATRLAKIFAQKAAKRRSLICRRVPSWLKFVTESGWNTPYTGGRDVRKGVDADARLSRSDRIGYHCSFGSERAGTAG